MYAPHGQAVMQDTIVASEDDREVNPSLGEKRGIMVVNNKSYRIATFVY